MYFTRRDKPHSTGNFSLRRTLLRPIQQVSGVCPQFRCLHSPATLVCEKNRSDPPPLSSKYGRSLKILDVSTYEALSVPITTVTREHVDRPSTEQNKRDVLWERGTEAAYRRQQRFVAYQYTASFADMRGALLRLKC